MIDFWLFAIAIFLGALLAGITVWSRRRLRWRIMSVAVFALFVPIVFLAFTHLLSRAKPIDLTFFETATEVAMVKGAHFIDGKGIYLWLMVPWADEPRYYIMPWGQETAEELQDALREAEENQSGVEMLLPFEDPLDRRENMFHALPQPAMPPKIPEPETGERLDRT